jgi:uncharacterized protein YkwD
VELRQGIGLVVVAVVVLVSFAGGPQRVAALMDRDDGGCAGSTRIPSGDTLFEARQATLCLLNAERAEHRLPPLAVDVRLEAAAQNHSQDMGARDFYAHDTPDGVQPAERVFAEGVPRVATMVAENIHWGVDVNARPKQIVIDWMNSPGHRANILNPSLTHIGVGVAFDAPERVHGAGAVYTTNFLGQPPAPAT